MILPFNTIDLGQKRVEKPKLLLTQPTWLTEDWREVDGLYFHNEETKARSFVTEMLEVARELKVTAVLFPELSIPESLITIISAWAVQNDSIVIAGSHYSKTASGYVNRAPIIFKDQIFYNEKIIPSPLEISPVSGESLSSGQKLNIFRNSPIGDFSVLICADYLAPEVKNEALSKDLDILLIPAFQRKSETYHKRMSIDCESSVKGIYMAYSNNFLEGIGDGKSAFFGLMDRAWQSKLVNKVTDGKPQEKVCELRKGDDFVLVEFDLSNKKPTLGKNVHNRPNIYIRNQNSREIKIGHTSDRNEDTSILKSKLDELKKEIREFVYRLIARHGLDDENWIKALSSQYFLSKIAIDLEITDREDFKNLIDSFFPFFTPRHDDSIELLESRVLVTPDENARLMESMRLEDQQDDYYKSSSKTLAENIKPELIHENYLYGVALGISSRYKSNFMQAVSDSTINHFLYNKSYSVLDNHGGWYPYRVPWITARILISFSEVDLSRRQDSEYIEAVISNALDSLIKRLHPDGYWRSGVGSWVSNWESTALCLEAFAKNDHEKRYSAVLESIVQKIIDNIDKWSVKKPSFDNEESANNTLGYLLLISIIIQLKHHYDFDSSIALNQEVEFLDKCKSILGLIIDSGDMELRQFCTIPQIASYCVTLTN